MIICITGLLGTGKTTLAVEMILNKFKGVFDADPDIVRPLYFNHIRGLKARELNAQELTDAEIKSMPIQDLVPHGSVVVVDEADYIYPTMGVGRDVPDYIKQLKEVRHYNITLILITQDPTMLHAYLRKIIGKHLHIEKKPTGFFLYDFSRVQSEINNTVLKNTASRPYRHSKEARKYFDSTVSGKHIKLKYKLHWAFFILPVILGLVGWQFNKVYQDKYAKPDSVEVQSASTESGGHAQFVSASEVNPGLKADMSKSLQPSDYVPTIPEKVWTKPIYDEVRQVKTFEYPVALLESNGVCKAYSEQGTLIDVPQNDCKKWLKDGLFNPYHEKQQFASHGSVTKNEN